jgi:type IV pilus assembly protein PilN
VIRTNLSTRPFYNEGAVRLWVIVTALVVAAATAFNISRLIQYSRSDTELATQASRDEARTADLRAAAVQMRARVDPRQVDVASVEARVANDLIDRRTFSWTELFNRLEKTLPPEVRITSVRPHIEKDRRIVLTITVLARGVDDIDLFMENLEATGAFAGLGSRLEERVNEAGRLESTIEAEYVARPPVDQGQSPRTDSATAPAPRAGRSAAPRRPSQDRREPLREAPGPGRGGP